MSVPRLGFVPSIYDTDGYEQSRTALPVTYFQLLHPAAKLPERQTEGAACWDLACVEDVWLSAANPRQLVSTGVAIELPPGYVGLVCSRSGLAAKHGIFVVNAPGVIDADYRGEIKVALGLLSDDHTWPTLEPTLLRAGTRIAQLLVLSLPLMLSLQVDNLSTTDRGTGGFGSTGA